MTAHPEVVLPRGDSPLPAKKITLRSASPDSYASNPPPLNAMGVVHEPVEDAIGQRGISYLFVPPRVLIPTKKSLTICQLALWDENRAPNCGVSVDLGSTIASVFPCFFESSPDGRKRQQKS